MRHLRSFRHRVRRPVRPASPDSALQRLADDSPAQRRLAQLQLQAGAVFQRADEDETAPAPDPVPVILSMDGAMIGSVYFETGRIRGTHVSGPADERGKHEFIERYNIDRTLAMKAYEEAVSKNEHGGEKFSRWISYKLWNSDDHPWVIAKIGSAEETDEGPAPKNAMLFENFGDTNRKTDELDLTSRHPSRGAAVKEMMPVGDLQALETAVGEAKDGSAMARNQAFYASLLANAPALALRMRLPEEVAAEQAEKHAEYALKAEARLGQIAGVNTKDYVPAALAPHVKRFNKKRAELRQLISLCRQAALDAEDSSYRAAFVLRASIQSRAINAAERAWTARDSIKSLDANIEGHVGTLVRNSGGKLKKPARAITSPVVIPDWVKDETPSD